MRKKKVNLREKIFISALGFRELSRRLAAATAVTRSRWHSIGADSWESGSREAEERKKPETGNALQRRALFPCPSHPVHCRPQTLPHPSSTFKHNSIRGLDQGIHDPTVCPKPQTSILHWKPSLQNIRL